MRPDGPVEDLTAAQKLMAKIAGIPADRPGIGAEYPKMVYRPGVNERHMLLGERLKIAGRFECETALVDNPDDEAEALASGWFTSPDPEVQEQEAAKREAELAKDREIADLRAQLAASNERRGPGRPPKQPDA